MGRRVVRGKGNLRVCICIVQYIWVPSPFPVPSLVQNTRLGRRKVNGEPLLPPSRTPFKIPHVYAVGEHLLESPSGCFWQNQREIERRRRGGSCAALCPQHEKKEAHYVLRRGGITKLDRRTAQTKPRGISFLLLLSAVRTVCVRGDLRYAVSVAVRSAALSANFLPYLTSELASPCDLT